MKEAVESRWCDEALAEPHMERRQKGRPRSSKGEGWKSAKIDGDDITIHQM